MSKSFKTSKGTELPILNLRGKDYLEVRYRLVWFREDHPDWSIETELVKVTDVSAIAKCTIKDDKGRILSTGHKHEDKNGFPDFHEKAESGSMGRALALLGYGTQFVGDELDEGERIVDSPVQPKTKTQAASKSASKEPASRASTPDVFNDEDYGSYVCSFGKHRGKKIKDIGEHDLDGFVSWLKKQPNRSPSAELFIEKADAYLTSREFPDPRLNRHEEIA